MKRTIAALLALTLLLALSLAAAAEDVAEQWRETFNEMWNTVMPTAFTFDETPTEGALYSGNLSGCILLTVTEGVDGKVEVLAEIVGELPIDEEAQAEEQLAPLEAEKSAVMIALLAALRAQRPELAEDSEAMNSLSMALATELFLAEGYATEHDGEQKTLQFENDIVYVAFIESSSETAWYKLIL